MRLSYMYEQILFHPKWYHYLYILVLLPMALLYGIGMWIRRKTAKRNDFGIPIISVGNLIVGGSGKTPFVIALASRYDKVTIVSRGYGRQSKGLIEVSYQGEVLTDVIQSGDEAMLMAQSLQHASVIVSEDRSKGIMLAKQQGASLIILDDGFNQVGIEKFEIILEPMRIENYLPFPAGPFREFFFCKYMADIVVKEGRDFFRKVIYKNLQERMLLVTAISDPERLNVYLPKGVIQKIYLPDHDYFDEKELIHLMKEYQAESLLVTQKDEVKMKSFKLPLSKMKLELDINKDIFQKIEEYVEGYRREKQD
ncbi:MAG: tetraacyldisaccharide 4'-kinase [Sulfurovum sp.]|nr:tetraacyldisaccharide 4'-kinase [Sulfurovum sp.]MCB4760119.1 tetraacyldisaccharide 4'-kinase [Sulfurovum sp.]